MSISGATKPPSRLRTAIRPRKKCSCVKQQSLEIHLQAAFMYALTVFMCIYLLLLYIFLYLYFFAFYHIYYIYAFRSIYLEVILYI